MRCHCYEWNLLQSYNSSRTYLVHLTCLFFFLQLYLSFHSSLYPTGHKVIVPPEQQHLVPITCVYLHIHINTSYRKAIKVTPSGTHKVTTQKMAPTVPFFTSQSCFRRKAKKKKRKKKIKGLIVWFHFGKVLLLYVQVPCHVFTHCLKQTCAFLSVIHGKNTVTKFGDLIESTAWISLDTVTPIVSYLIHRVGYLGSFLRLRRHFIKKCTIYL